MGFKQIGFGVRVKATSQVGSVRRQCTAIILINRAVHNTLCVTWLHKSKHKCETLKCLVLPDPDTKAQRLFETPATVYKLARLNIPEELNLYEHNLIMNVSISHKDKTCIFRIFSTDYLCLSTPFLKSAK